MDFKVNYSWLDRLIHHIAFLAPSVQLAAENIEEIIFGSVYENIEITNPIFITALPRAGTTVLLEALSQFPSLSAHNYRDMPFILAPLLWSKISGPFQIESKSTVRAHNDGIKFNYDSPESFEEVIWYTFWTEKYSQADIKLWEICDNKDDARIFFKSHMKKIIALRSSDDLNNSRYLSKNNCNIARIELIKHIFPHSSILVPIRHPLNHATSLLRQHINFLKLHKFDPFIRRYMENIGHYEFGELHRLIAFPGIEDIINILDPLSIDYWLAYWNSAYKYIYTHRDNLLFICHEQLCNDGYNTLRNICEYANIEDESIIQVASALFKEEKYVDMNITINNQDILTDAIETYDAIIMLTNS